MSETPGEFEAFVDHITGMWTSGPNYTEGQLGRIKSPVAIVAGEHDEIIAEEHSRALAKQIPHSHVKIMPGLSHFGL